MLKRSRIYLLAAIFYAAFIFYLSSIPNPPNPISYGLMRQIYHMLSESGLGFLAYPFYLYVLFPDKFIHFFLYLGFGVILNLAFRAQGSGFASSAFFAIFAGSIYAATDEVHQIFTPFRSASFSDFLADFFGILVAQLLILLGIKVSGFLNKLRKR
jgi:VanZ family protein